MEELRITPQLNSELEKLKAGDYTSYQEFYSQTSTYLYGKIFEKVNDQNIAGELTNTLYTEIYESIGTELTDNSQFYTWATGKADTITNTYLTTHNMVANEDNNKNKDAALAFAALNSANGAASGNAVAGGLGATGVGEVNGATAGVGMSAASGSSAGVGIGTASGSNAGVGIGAASGGNAGVGIGAASGSNAGVGMGTASSALVGAAGKTGIALGMKLAIGAVLVAAVGTAAVWAHNNKEDNTTEVTTEVVSDGNDDLDLVQTPADASETDATTEETVESDTKLRYAAYYEVVKPYFEQYPTYVKHTLNEGTYANTGVHTVNLVDMNGDGKEELVVCYRDGSDYHDPVKLDMYEYNDGEVSLVTSVECGRAVGDISIRRVSILDKEDGNKVVWVVEQGRFRASYGESYYTSVEYDASNNIIINSYENVDGDCHANGEACEVTFIDEIARQAIVDDTKADNYQWGDSRTILAKHRTVERLCEAAEDTSFVNENDVAFYEAAEEYTYLTNVNKYNEIYELHFYKNDEADESNVEISADGKSIHIMCASDFSDNQSWLYIEGNFNNYYTYVEDVVICTGFVRDGWYEADDTYVEGPFYIWKTADDYYEMNKRGNVLTKEEYDARGNELMSGQ